MSTIFSVRPGYALAVRDTGAAPLLVGLTDWGDISSGGGFANMKAIITSLSVAEGANYQIQNTLRKFFYVYTMGDRPGDINVSGIAFAGSCDADGDPGVTNVLRYYQQHRVSRRAGPVGVVIGGAAFRCLLTDMQVGIDNPQAGLGVFTLSLKTLPDRNN